MYSTRLILSLSITAVALGGMVVSCGPSSGHGGGGGSGGTGGGAIAGSDAGAGGGGGSAGGGGSSSCTGLRCQQMTCANGTTTTLTGKVFAPNGTLPLYNAIVYVPNATPAAFTDGVTCDRCNGQVSGDPIVTTLSDASGSFTLSNVPAGSNIPLVIQLGKWRRQVTIPSVPSCQSTALAAAMTRLPTGHAEGDLPKMAIATGSADPLECLLLKIGIDPAEITPPSGNGRLHFYLGATQPGTTMSGAPSESDASSGLFSSLQQLEKYDVVLLPCEGTNNYSGTKANERQLLTQYLDAGGRVFTTHYSYQWLTYQGSPYNAVSTDNNPNNGGGWHIDQPQPCGMGSNCGYMGTLDTSFPKGMAFNQWLAAVTMPPLMGSFEITDPRNDLDGVNAMLAQRWMYHAGDNKVLHMTFNTPLHPPTDDMGAPQYCGRVVFSDFHVSAYEATANGTFPGACMAGPLTTQEKALAFMLFDLSSCVQSDQTPPIQ